MRRYERKNLILKVGEGNVSHLAGAEVRRQIGKLQLMLLYRVNRLQDRLYSS